MLWVGIPIGEELGGVQPPPALRGGGPGLGVGRSSVAAPSLGVSTSCQPSQPSPGNKIPRGASKRAAWGRAGPGEAAGLPGWGQIPPAGKRGAGGAGMGFPFGTPSNQGAPSARSTTTT